MLLLLTSTCIQMLYFLQMSEMAMRGSKAPYTVVPAVALTKKGTRPCGDTSFRVTADDARLPPRRHIIAAPSVWPPGFSSQGRPGSFFHCRDTQKNSHHSLVWKYCGYEQSSSTWWSAKLEGEAFGSCVWDFMMSWSICPSFNTQFMYFSPQGFQLRGLSTSTGS